MGSIGIVKSIYESFGRGDVPAVLGAMHPNIEWREAESNPYEMSGAAWVGPDAIVQNLFAKLGAEWTPFVVTPQSFYDAGETVVVEGRYTGKYGATGSDLNAQFCHVWKLEGEKITSFQQFTDTAQFQKVMNRP